MKTRALAILLIVLLAFGMAPAALAADSPANGNIKIKAPSGRELSDRTFDAYLLFTITNEYLDDKGTPDTNDDTMAYAYVATDLAKAFIATLTDTADFENNDYVDYVRNLSDAGRNAFGADFKVYVYENSPAITRSATADDGDTSVEMTVPYGYYIILESTADFDDGVAPMLFALDQTDIDIYVKSEFTDFDKDIMDDTTPVDLIDLGVGKTVPYRLSSDYPRIAADTTAAWHKFTDTMEDGLTFNPDSLTVTIGTDTFTNAQIVSGLSGAFEYAAPGAGGETFTLKIDFLKFDPLRDVAEGAKVYVNYTAVVNENAVVYGIENNATLDFSGNPSDTGDVLTDKTTVYTYGFDVLKTDADVEEPAVLEGVKFELYPSKIVEENTVIDDTAPLTFSIVGGVYVYNPAGTVTELVTGANGKINVIGLDEGTFFLKEIATLPGFNLLTAPVKIVIAAIYDRDALTGLWMVNGTAATESAIPLVNVVNYAGPEIPSTGGIGRVLFPVIGGIVVIGACAVLFINRKRVFGE